MPGISVRAERTDEPPFRESLRDLLFEESYDETVAWADGDMGLGYTGQPEYRVSQYDTDDYTVLLEGDLFDVSDRRSTALSLADGLFSDDETRLREWLDSRDAVFVLAAREKESGAIRLLTGPLARLPLYASATGGAAAVSRELASLLADRDVDPDRVGIGQQLLFGYPLGDRTIYREVRRVPPASVVELEPDDVTITQLTQLDVEPKPHAGKSVTENATALADRITAATRRRLGPGPNVLSLSGGLDSRALAACLGAGDTPLVAATYTTGDSSVDEEARAAARIVDLLDGEWHQVQLDGDSDPAQRARLVELKRGLNQTSVAFLLEFLEELRDTFGPELTRITGDGGDKSISLTAPRSFRGIDDVVDFLLATQTRFDVETVVELTGLTERELRAGIRERLRSYPESDPTQKYLHFEIRERGLNWVAHGEDRNRYVVRHVAPLFAYPVLEYAMGVPDSQKRHEALYGEIIGSYSRELLDVPYVDVGAPIGSLEYRLKTRLYDIAARFPRLRERAIDYLVRSDRAVDSATRSTLRRAVDRPEHHASVLSTDVIAAYAEGTRSTAAKNVTYLETVLLALERLGETASRGSRRSTSEHGS